MRIAGVLRRLYVDTERVVNARLADPFAELLAEDLIEFLEQGIKNPDAIRAVRVRLRTVWWR